MTVFRWNSDATLKGETIEQTSSDHGGEPQTRLELADDSNPPIRSPEWPNNAAENKARREDRQIAGEGAERERRPFLCSFVVARQATSQSRLAVSLRDSWTTPAPSTNLTLSRLDVYQPPLILSFRHSTRCGRQRFHQLVSHYKVYTSFHKPAAIPEHRVFLNETTKLLKLSMMSPFVQDARCSSRHRGVAYEKSESDPL